MEELKEQKEKVHDDSAEREQQRLMDIYKKSIEEQIAKEKNGYRHRALSPWCPHCNPPPRCPCCGRPLHGDGWHFGLIPGLHY